ncbi:hypothetical protein NNC19_16865 [Clostridium sp. SHJSY1]|uniref:DUF6414 family protein n=1 Tax=Clostridium sp. SHJSY1 TaxID=2942483 RepID=UPI0028752C41|nr:hypothetical protein [Clostridium sp. SHJSY1]MDS0527364.1 hypothetical protein [Clostridium sp. SHJSY1]
MDEDLLSLFMYLDEGLVKNLSSLFLSGYIEVRTTRLVQDKTITGRAGIDSRERIFGEDRFTEDDRQGYKTNNCVNVEQTDNGNSTSAGVENRDFVRVEEELKKIYTTFSFHRQVISSLNKSNAIKNFNNKTINEGDLSEGDYVQIRGKLTTESVNSYLDSLLTVFNCFGCDSLNKMISSRNNQIMNFTAMNSLIGHLNDILSKNSTKDMILTCGDTPVVINVNENFFMNNNAYIYDRVDCPCTVFGKVISVAPNGKCVSLLRKTAQHDYYESVLNSCTSYCNLLNSNGIIMPKMPRLKCEGVSVVVVPISICM